MQSADLPDPSPCPECGGPCVHTKVAGQVYLQRPGATFGGVSTTRAVVCTRCGYARLYALEPAKLVPRT
jgi:hypothetical protein